MNFRGTDGTDIVVNGDDWAEQVAQEAREKKVTLYAKTPFEGNGIVAEADGTVRLFRDIRWENYHHIMNGEPLEDLDADSLALYELFG